MKAFRFSWQRVLEFRATRLSEEERKLRVLQEEREKLARELHNVEQLRHNSARALAVAETSRGEDLKTLMLFQARLRRDQATLSEKMAACTQKLARQQEVFMAARREHKLLEKLRERRLAEWVQASNRETEKLATELYLARWEGHANDDRQS